MSVGNPKKYDLIYLSLVQTTLSEIYEMALTENYVYTIEAFREYIHHLNPNGMIAIWAHDDGLMARTVLTGLESLKKEGVDYPNNTGHIAVLTSTDQNKHYSYLILISQTPFTLKEEDEIVVPNSHPEWLPSDQEVKNVQNLREAEILLRKRIDSKEHPDILPVYDNRPFFFNVHGLYPPVLKNLTFGVAFGLILLMGVSFVNGFKPLKNEITKWRKYVGWPAYFAFLGIGFMLIEVTLMQRFLLWLGSPIYAFSFLLFCLLIGAGVGSFLSEGLTTESRKKVIFISIGIIAVFAYLGIGFGLPNLFDIGVAWPYFLRYLSALIFTIALGIPMGIPFPIGMVTIRDLKLKGIPWAWSINGVASVLGSLLAVLLSQLYGISNVALLGAICYILAGFAFNLCQKELINVSR